MRIFMRIYYYLAAAALIIAGSCSGQEAVNAPNIIVVLTDDQGYADLSCHGSPDVSTPSLDRLHSESVRFTDFHAEPTCAPTRSALMTGKYPFMNGISHTKYDRERMALSSLTIAELLRDQGYCTGIFGKWHLGDEPEYQPDKRGFDEVFIHGAGGIGQDLPYTCADVPGNSYFDPVIKHNGIFKKTRGFCTDVFFTQALGWISSQKDSGKPFFAWISTNAPHAPYLAPDKYRQKFMEKGYPPDAQGFYGMIENIDDNVGVLLEKLQEYGMEDNTVLIFMSDNGKAYKDSENPAKTYNAGMRGFKTTPYQGGTRIPFFFRWPAVTGTEGRDVQHLAAHIDLFPTLAAVAGTEPVQPDSYTGRNLLPLIKGEVTEWEDRMIFFHVARWLPEEDPSDYKYRKYAVRNERYRLVAGEELHDIENDPGEQVNLIEDQPGQAERMVSAYELWWDFMLPYLINENREPSDSEPPFHAEYEKQLKETGIPDWEAPDF